MKKNLSSYSEEGLSELPTVSSTKYLGIVLDNNTTWNRTVYYALFESYLRYSITACGTVRSIHLERILLQQKKVIRCMADFRLQNSFQRAENTDSNSLEYNQINNVCCLNRTIKVWRHDHNTRYTSNFSLSIHHLSLFTMKPS